MQRVFEKGAAGARTGARGGSGSHKKRSSCWRRKMISFGTDACSPAGVRSSHSRHPLDIHPGHPVIEEGGPRKNNIDRALICKRMTSHRSRRARTIASSLLTRPKTKYTYKSRLLVPFLSLSLFLSLALSLSLFRSLWPIVRSVDFARSKVRSRAYKFIRWRRAERRGGVQLMINPMGGGNRSNMEKRFEAAPAFRVEWGASSGRQLVFLPTGLLCECLSGNRSIID